MPAKAENRTLLLICTDCLSTGKVGSKPCEACDGTGEIKRTITVFVPDKGEGK